MRSRERTKRGDADIVVLFRFCKNLCFAPEKKVTDACDGIDFSFVSNSFFASNWIHCSCRNNFWIVLSYFGCFIILNDARRMFSSRPEPKTASFFFELASGDTRKNGSNRKSGLWRETEWMGQSEYWALIYRFLWLLSFVALRCPFS